MNNRQPDYSLPQGTCADAVNGDFDNMGRFARRQGYEKVTALAGGHSAKATSQGIFLVNGFELCRWTPNGLEALAQVSGEPMHFVEHNDTVFWTDGVDTGRIVDGVVKRWGIDAPEDTFLLTTSDRTSHPGDVTVALTYVRDDGVESGLSPAKQITSSPDATVTVTSLPLTGDPDVAQINVYAGRGETLYLESTVAAGATATSFTLTGAGRPAEQRRLDPPPAGNGLALFRGRVYITVGSYLIYSDPFRPEHFDLAGGFIPFEHDIEIVAPVEAGIYVAAGGTMFLRGTDPDQFQIDQILHYGAVPGTAVDIPNTSGVMWMSTLGAVMGDASGNAQNVQEQNVAVGVSNTLGDGAAMIRERRGLRQFVAVSPAATNRFARAR